MSKIFEVFDDFSSEMAVYNKWDRDIFPAPLCPSGILISMAYSGISVILLTFSTYFSQPQIMLSKIPDEQSGRILEQKSANSSNILVPSVL